jgi:hypothetical protein
LLLSVPTSMEVPCSSSCMKAFQRRIAIHCMCPASPASCCTVLQACSATSWKESARPADSTDHTSEAYAATAEPAWVMSMPSSCCSSSRTSSLGSAEP